MKKRVEMKRKMRVPILSRIIIISIIIFTFIPVCGDPWTISETTPEMQVQGKVLVNQTYGGTNSDIPAAIIQDEEGNLVIAGATGSYARNLMDMWLVKTNASGNPLWNCSYDGITYDLDCGTTVLQMASKGYLLGGITESNETSSDFWLVATDQEGQPVWNRTYGGKYYDYCTTLLTDPSGGYLLGGSTTSFGGGSNIWLLKINASGEPLWNQTYGGSAYESCHALIVDPQGGFLLAGNTASYGKGNFDFWLLKIDTKGRILWDQTYGGKKNDQCATVIVDPRGGYLLAGRTQSYSVEEDDFWLIKTDVEGWIVWNRTYGGPMYDYCSEIFPTSDGGLLLVGRTRSYGTGILSLWLLEIDQTGLVRWNQTYGGASMTYPNSAIALTNNTYAILAATDSYGKGFWDAWLLIIQLEYNPSSSSSNTSELTTRISGTGFGLVILTLIIRRRKRISSKRGKNLFI